MGAAVIDIAVLTVLAVLSTVLASSSILKLKTVGPSWRIRRIWAKKVVVVALPIPDYLTALVEYFAVRSDFMKLMLKVLAIP